jgi:hypothetical protein
VVKLSKAPIDQPQLGYKCQRQLFTTRASPDHAILFCSHDRS